MLSEIPAKTGATDERLILGSIGTAFGNVPVLVKPVDQTGFLTDLVLRRITIGVFEVIVLLPINSNLMKKLLQRERCRGVCLLQFFGVQVFMALFFLSAAFGQNSTFAVTGTVVDANSVSIPGVNVIEKGTTNGSTTDADGRFTLNVQNESATLIFSFIGYVPNEVSLNGRSIINVTLAEEVTELDAVVVIGYGTAKKGRPDRIRCERQC